MKYSKQREMIRALVADCRTHPTADEIYGMLRPMIPHISLATVYRNLNMLAEQGVLRKITVSGGPDRFDGNIKEHYHMVCTHCGEMMDLETDFFDDIARKIEQKHDFTVTNHRLIVYGVCKKCSNNNT